jgi:hypothetical protein
MYQSEISAMTTPSSPSELRTLIIEQVMDILTDGRPRSAKQLVAELARRDLTVSTHTVNSTLSIQGRGRITYDRTTYTYSLSRDSVANLVLPLDRSPFPAAPHLDTSPELVLFPRTPRIYVSKPDKKPLASFDTYATKFRQALTDEIRSVRAGGGQKSFLSDGRFISSRGELYLYSFSADTELKFPDDVPVDVEYRGDKYPGIILTIDGFDLLLGLYSFIGDHAPTAVLFTAPWFLLQGLIDRLSSASTGQWSNRRLATALLSTNARPAPPPDLDATRTLLSKIEKRNRRKLHYNDDQLSAIARVLSAPVTFVWGPPGTGKTSTVGMAVAALVEAGESDLVLAHSNAAVDVAMRAIAANLERSPEYEEGFVLRFGGAPGTLKDDFPNLDIRNMVRVANAALVGRIEALEQRKRELVKKSRSDSPSLTIQYDLDDIKERLKPLHEKLRELESSYVRAATVVGCTLSKATIAPEIFEAQFDAVIVDEASMAYIPHCSYAATLAARRLAVFGDFRQLAPIAQSKTSYTQEWLHRDIFEAAGIIDKVDSGKNDPRLILLRTQYRMHPSIAAIPNRLFYNNQLANGTGIDRQTIPITQSRPDPGQSLVLYDLAKLSASCFTEPHSHSRFNLISAIVTAQLAYKAASTPERAVGVITPYTAQSRLIWRILQDVRLRQASKTPAPEQDSAAPLLSSENKIRVATVHRFQGSEEDVILFDTVEGPPKTKVGKLVLGDINSAAMRLANVAISRTKGKFIALLDYPYLTTHLQGDDIFLHLIRSIEASGVKRVPGWPPPDPQGKQQQLMPGVAIYSGSSHARAQITADLTTTKEHLALVWPCELASHHFSLRSLSSLDPSRVHQDISIKPGQKAFYLQHLQNARIWETHSHRRLGFVGIDSRLLWVYLDPANPASPVLRLALPGTTKLLYAYFWLVPESELRLGNVEERLTSSRGLVGRPCPHCHQPLWVRRGSYNVYLACTTNGCGYTNRYRRQTPPCLLASCKFGAVSVGSKSRVVEAIGAFS